MFLAARDNQGVQLAAMSFCKVGPGKFYPNQQPHSAADFAAGARDMSQHRLKCRNQQCAYEGMMEAKSDRPNVKKIFAEKAQEKLKSRGIAAVPEVMQIRCPKCGMRWRSKADQLR